ncbi:WbqC family protein [Pseudomonas putida]|uniref:WbqC family protein n=1 Tax=Pseudomonas putida TaxID=303 RepID=A0A6I6XKR4_PSEPU|nr:WbqC family protein [Pseudomonas putida]QHG66293.1 WbqC family protein [Pseudomonas putida]
MQPYFFPYLGHFALIAHTDQWVVFDVTQYTPRSWMNRNRVLHPQAGWNYISAPLIQSSTTLLTREARVKDLEATQRSVLGKLSHYRRKAPHYEAVVDLVAQTFARTQNNGLVQLNIAGLVSICDYLGLPFDYQVCSELGLDLGTVNKPGGWAPEICRQMGAASYLNPEGGRALFDPQDFALLDIQLEFMRFASVEYTTNPYAFEPGLSILDVMMWNAPEQIAQLLRSQAQVGA